ncbi:HNH endonuclease family protein [Terrabacter terrigena]|uniref:HNH endonuclease family protein n=1 Tax=Terrabacter terrigena TaxID=574718 RepID=A0ABW3MZ11_9MICO
MPRLPQRGAPELTRTPAPVLAVAALAVLLAGCGLPPLTGAAPGGRSHAPTDVAAPGPGTTTSLPRTSTPTISAAQARVALSQLSALPVKGRAPKTGYSREQFGPAWTDDIDVAGGHNGCDTRNDVLRRDLTAERLKPGTRGCVVLSGRLADPYTGRVIAFERGASSSKVQIDHVVALGDAWVKGGQRLTRVQRISLANDPLNLLAVDGPTNSAKRDSDAASWLPPNRGFRCTYVARQVAVKTRYHLWVTAAEKAAVARVLNGCR